MRRRDFITLLGGATVVLPASRSPNLAKSSGLVFSRCKNTRKAIFSDAKRVAVGSTCAISRRYSYEEQQSEQLRPFLVGLRKRKSAVSGGAIVAHGYAPPNAIPSI